MGQDFFVRWKGVVCFELIHQDDLERKLEEGAKAEEIYFAGAEVHYRKFIDGDKKRIKLFAFI